MSISCECCVLSGRGLCDGPNTRPEQSYWLWCVTVCDLETSPIRRPWPALGCCAGGKLGKIYYLSSRYFTQVSGISRTWTDLFTVLLYNWNATFRASCNNVLSSCRYTASVELSRQERTQVLGDKPVPVPLYPSQISCWLSWERSRAYTRPSAWVMIWHQLVRHSKLIKPPLSH